MKGGSQHDIEWRLIEKGTPPNSLKTKQKQQQQKNASSTQSIHTHQLSEPSQLQPIAPDEQERLSL